MADTEQLPTTVCEGCLKRVYTYAITAGLCPSCRWARRPRAVAGRVEAQVESTSTSMGADRRVQVGDTDYEVAIYEGRLTIFGCDCCESVPTVENAEAIRDLIEEWIHYTPKAH